MSDPVKIKSLLAAPLESNEALENFAETDIRYITDINQNDYKSNTIRFNTDVLRSQWWSLKDASLVIPLQIKSSGGAYDKSEMITWKQSILSFITSVQVNTTNGQTIVNERLIPLVNHLRLLTEYNVEFVELEGGDINFDKEISELALGNVGLPLANTDPAVNPHLNDRITVFKSRCQFVTDTYSCVVSIPLRFLSDFFKQCTAPLINTSFELIFGFNDYSLPAMYCDDDAPTLEIKDAKFAGSDIGFNQCRLYYTAVKFQPDINKQLVGILNSGLTRKFFYRTSDTYLGLDDDKKDNDTFSRLLSASTVRPTRIWLLGTLKDARKDSKQLLTYPASFKSVNCLINNEPLYKSPISTPEEFWKILQEQFPTIGSDMTRSGYLNYTDFLTNYRLHCLDCDRFVRSKLSDPNASVSIQIDATRDNKLEYPVGTAKTADVLYIVERLTGVSFYIDNNSVKITTGVNI